MESINTSGQALATSRVVEKVTSRKIFTIVALLVAGAALIHFSYSLNHMASLQLTLLFCGVGIAMWGGVIALFAAKEKVDAVTGKRVIIKIKRYPSEDRSRIVGFLDSENFEALHALPVKDQGDLQLSVYYTTDGNYLSVQLFEWKDYTLRKVSGVYSFDGAHAQNSIPALRLN